MAKANVVIVGGGVGGILTANLLAKQAQKIKVQLIDATGTHVYQPGWLRVPFGDYRPESLRYPIRQLLHPSVELIVEPAERIDLEAHRVVLTSGKTVPYDYLVIGTGSYPHPEEVPGLAQGAHTFYTEEGAVQLGEALKQFRGGRIVVGVSGFPYKCPPAPHEFTLLLDDWLRANNLRQQTELTFVTPINRLFPIETVAPVFENAFKERNICVETFFNAESVDPEKRVVSSLEGTELKYDLLIMIAPHRGASVVSASGLGDRGGWIPTDKQTLQVKGHENLYALGDATDLPVSKSGAAAHFEAEVVARRLIEAIEGRIPEHLYDGHVMCMIETGANRAMLIDFDYQRPPRTPKPSHTLKIAKGLFRRAYPLAVLKAPLTEGIRFFVRPGEA
ncbi:MAG: FAD-dependent oxidoreductase [Fimbriimonadales bacterium]